MKKSTSRKAFTLIEVIIAMMIFGIGVLVLLRAVIFFVGEGDDVRKRAQATLLAKEAMELVLTNRDTNLLKGVRWDCAQVSWINTGIAATDDACDIVFTSGTQYTVTSTMTGYSIGVLGGTGNLGGDARLYTSLIDGVTRYTHTTSGSPTDFMRTITVSPATAQGQSFPTSHVWKVTVRVGYIPTAPARAVVLESYMAAGETVDAQ